MTERGRSRSWLRFSVGDEDFAIALGDVAEVTPAKRPRLIPRVPLEVGGVLNVGGEPLPAVDGGMLLCGVPTSEPRHTLVLSRGELRLGVIVEWVARIDRDIGDREARGTGESGEDSREPDFVRWVDDGGERLGLVDSEALLIRAADLLAGRAPLKEGDRCSNAL